MATPTSFQEQNAQHTTATGEQYPVWIRPAKLGNDDTYQTISAWQLTQAELAAVNDSNGFVFVTFTGILPPMNILGADAVPFEGQNTKFTHPDCFDLPVFYKDVLIGETPTFIVTSAWQLTPEQLAQTNDETDGIIFLLVVGDQPTVSISGINPIEL